MKTDNEKQGHTPVPWRLVTHTIQDGKHTDSSHAVILANRFGGNAAPLQLARIAWAAYDKELDANARLIAAAPDLLKACEKASYALQRGISDNKRGEAWLAVNAAIAKATDNA